MNFSRQMSWTHSLKMWGREYRWKWNSNSTGRSSAFQSRCHFFAPMEHVANVMLCLLTICMKHYKESCFCMKRSKTDIALVVSISVRPILCSYLLLALLYYCVLCTCYKVYDMQSYMEESCRNHTNCIYIYIYKIILNKVAGAILCLEMTRGVFCYVILSVALMCKTLLRSKFHI